MYEYDLKYGRKGQSETKKTNYNMLINPYDLENYCVNLHHIIHVNFTRCFWHDPIGMFQKFAILTILQRFQNKK